MILYKIGILGGVCMNKNNKKGFSVIELLAVIVIVGLLVAIAVPVVNKQLNNFRHYYYSN